MKQSRNKSNDRFATIAYVLLTAGGTQPSLAQTPAAIFSMNATEVHAGTTTPVSNPNGLIEPGEGVLFRLSIGFAPVVGTPMQTSQGPGTVAGFGDASPHGRTRLYTHPSARHRGPSGCYPDRTYASQNEVDVLIEEPHRFSLIEARSGATVPDDLLRHLAPSAPCWAGGARQHHPIAVIGGGTRQRRSDLEVIPWNSLHEIMSDQ